MSGIFLKKKTKGEPASINLPVVPEGPNQGNAEKHVELDTDCHGPPIQPLVEFIVYTYTDHRHPPPPNNNTNTFIKFNIDHGLFLLFSIVQEQSDDHLAGSHWRLPVSSLMKEKRGNRKTSIVVHHLDHYLVLDMAHNQEEVDRHHHHHRLYTVNLTDHHEEATWLE